MVDMTVPEGQPVVTAQRVTLRPLTTGDTGLLHLYCSDKRVARMTRTIPHPYPPGAAEAFIKAALAPERKGLVWAIEARRDGRSELMGVIGLEPMDRGQCEIGYWVAPAFWNSGLATEAVGALLSANPMGCACAFGSVFQDNPTSARVLMKNGFDYIGDAEAFSVARGGIAPTWTYSKKLAQPT